MSTGHGGTCLNPRTWVVEARGPETQGHLSFIAIWRPAWATCEPVSTRRKQLKMKITSLGDSQPQSLKHSCKSNQSAVSLTSLVVFYVLFCLARSHCVALACLALAL